MIPHVHYIVHTQGRRYSGVICGDDSRGDSSALGPTISTEGDERDFNRGGPRFHPRGPTATTCTGALDTPPTDLHTHIHTL